MSDSVQPHRRQPTRLPHPWDSPGKNTGVGCHFLLQCVKVKSENEVAQSCPTLRDPMDCSLPGSSAHGIFQARVLEWGAIAFSHLSALVNSKSPERCPERESTDWTSGHQFSPEIKIGYFDPDQERGSSAGGWSRSRPGMRPISSSWPLRLRCCLTTIHPLYPPHKNLKEPSDYGLGFLICKTEFYFFVLS